MAKSSNLDYRRLADHLTDKGLVDRETIQHVLQQCNSTGSLLPEILVTEGFVSDWELSRVCAELFHLPYLPVECYPPKQEAREGLDTAFLRQYGLVPLDRFGNLLTLSMPGIVPGEVIDALTKDAGIHVLPVVGSVEGNRRWINHNFPESEALAAFGEATASGDATWSNLFDDADQAVNIDLGVGNPAGEEVVPTFDLGMDLEADLSGFDEMDLSDFDAFGDEAEDTAA